MRLYVLDKETNKKIYIRKQSLDREELRDKIGSNIFEVLDKTYHINDVILESSKRFPAFIGDNRLLNKYEEIIAEYFNNDKIDYGFYDKSKKLCCTCNEFEACNTAEDDYCEDWIDSDG